MSLPLKPLLPPSFWPSVHRLTVGDDWPPSNSNFAALFVEKCSWHGLLPLLFRENDLPPVVVATREKVAYLEQKFAVRALANYQVATMVCQILGKSPVILLKGSDFASRLYPNRALRPMQDIDVLVPEHQIETACKQLLDSGMVPIEKYGARRDPKFPTREFIFGDALVEVHHSFIQQPRHRIDYDGVWRRCEPLEFGGSKVFRLDDVDALVYQALTLAALDQFYPGRFIRFVDLWNLLSQRERIVEVAAERAKEWQVVHGLYAALSLARKLFPQFLAPDAVEAMTRALPKATRRFLDQCVIPSFIQIRAIERPNRWLQLWRKFWLMDSMSRRFAFVSSHAAAAVRYGWGRE